VQKAKTSPMRYILLFLFPVSLFGQKQITLEDIWQKGTFSAKGVPGFNFMKDGVRYTRQEGSAIVAYDLRTGKATDTIINAASLKSTATGWKNTFDSYQFSGDESKILFLQAATRYTGGVRRQIIMFLIWPAASFPGYMKGAGNAMQPSLRMQPK
jgi:hypothetical protein